MTRTLGSGGPGSVAVQSSERTKTAGRAISRRPATQQPRTQTTQTPGPRKDPFAAPVSWLGEGLLVGRRLEVCSEYDLTTYEWRGGTGVAGRCGSKHQRRQKQQGGGPVGRRWQAFRLILRAALLAAQSSLPKARCPKSTMTVVQFPYGDRRKFVKLDYNTSRKYEQGYLRPRRGYQPVHCTSMKMKENILKDVCLQACERNLQKFGSFAASTVRREALWTELLSVRRTSTQARRDRTHCTASGADADRDRFRRYCTAFTGTY